MTNESIEKMERKKREESLIEKGTGTEESVSKYFGMRYKSQKRLTATQIREQAWQRETRK